VLNHEMFEQGLLFFV